MLNITNHQENANQNHNDITSHLLGWLLLKTKAKQKLSSAGEDMEKSECHAMVMQKGTAPVRNSMMVPQNSNTELPPDSAISVLYIHSKELKADGQADMCTYMFTAALFTLVKQWNPSIH